MRILDFKHLVKHFISLLNCINNTVDSSEETQINELVLFTVIVVFRITVKDNEEDPKYSIEDKT